MLLLIFRTCFYVLGLVASTSVGADKLEDLGWESVRHRGSDKWPVIEQDVMYFLESDASDEEQVSASPFWYLHVDVQLYSGGGEGGKSALFGILSLITSERYT